MSARVVSVVSSRVEDMFEVDQQGVPHRVDALDQRAALDLLAGTSLDQRRAERARVRLVLRLVELALDSPADRARWARLTAGEEQLEAGDEDPGPDFSAHEELAGALGTSSLGADSWISDVLDIRFRLPRLHARFEALDADLWKVRLVARMTHWLPAEVAAHVDAALAERIDKVGTVGIGKAVALAIATLLPERLEEHDQHGQSGWHVRVHHPQPAEFGGTSVLDASADSVDLDEFEAATRKIAEELREVGDDDPLQIRMAKALGVMARRVLAPLHTEQDKPAPEENQEQPRAGDSGTKGCSTRTASEGPRPRGSARTLQVFVREATGADGVPRVFGEVPKWGVVSQSVLDRWMTSHAARFTRVVDLGRADAVDQHDPPPWMRALVILRDRHCVFPGCARAAEDCDLDHIVPYDENGPPGQTSPEKLACLCRGHHQLKTHAGWLYERARHGTSVWTSPLGRVYVVTPDGTHYLLDQAA